jgi:uncharacterized protein DUF3105
MGYPGSLHFAAVSSRQEEKQRRREERLAREQAEKAAAARRQRLMLGGAALALVAVVVVVVFVVIGGSDDSGGSAGSAGGNGTAAAAEVDGNPDTAEVKEGITLPEQQIGELEAAAEAAGCKLTNPPIEGRSHEEKTFTEADYKTNPPTSGTHFPEWYQDGVWDPTETDNLGMLVHTLEHGRINVQYKPGTPQHTVDQLEALLAENSEGYHMLLYQNGTNMDAQIAATAWGHSLTCPQFNNQVFDAIRTFRAAYIDKGPEQVP